jgi:hypothetical protein
MLLGYVVAVIVFVVCLIVFIVFAKKVFVRPLFI